MGSNNRGIALILTLWIMLALILLAAGIAMMARSETQIARNTADVNHCRWAARAGVYAAIKQLQTLMGEQTTYLTEDPYTINSTDLKMDLGGYTMQAVIQDEAGKVNINTAPLATLAAIFDDDDVADHVSAWRSPVSASSAQSSDTDYYSSLSPPYKCKNAPFETLKELQLVEGVTADTLSSPPPAVGNGAHQLMDLLTVYTPKTPRTSTATNTVDIQTATAQSLQSALGSVLNTQEINAIVQYRSRTAFKSPAEIVRVPGLSRAKIEEIYDRLTVSGATAHTGLVNINTATLEVLTVQPGMDAGMAEAILEYRAANGAFSSIGYLLAVNDVSNDAFVSAAPYLTVNSNVFKIITTGQSASAETSANITAVVEINSSGQAQIRYWQE